MLVFVWMEGKWRDGFFFIGIVNEEGREMEGRKSEEWHPSYFGINKSLLVGRDLKGKLISLPSCPFLFLSISKQTLKLPKKQKYLLLSCARAWRWSKKLFWCFISREIHITKNVKTINRKWSYLDDFTMILDFHERISYYSHLCILTQILIKYFGKTGMLKLLIPLIYLFMSFGHN